MSKLLHLKRAPKAVRSNMDTILITRESANQFRIPDFQRPLRINAKVLALAEEMKCNSGVVPGVLTIGIVNGVKYLVDGQHRVEAFRQSGLKEAVADVRECMFDNMAEMGEEFVNLQLPLVRMRPDDVLRGLAQSLPQLQLITERCPFVGYGQVRRGGEGGPIVSMSMILRTWIGSERETPMPPTSGAAENARSLTTDDAERLAEFLESAFKAWGRDPEYYRLWGGLNVMMHMWMWRRLVLGERLTSAKAVRLTKDQFRQGMMGASAESSYIDWLVGRNITDRDRGPCYGRLKNIFAARLEPVFGKRPTFPSPAWSSDIRARASI